MQMLTEKEVKLAATLYRIRDTTRQLLGDKYQRKMAEMGQVVRRAAAMNNMDTLQAAQWMAAQPEMQGHATETMLVLAAAVELIEPTHP
jgi:hypothetical protein